MRTVCLGGVLLWLGASVVTGAPLPGAPPLGPELAERIRVVLAGPRAGVKPRTRHLTPEGAPLYTNRLVLEQSPYLLQHAHNPVNWYPWGDEAFETARTLGRPVLLSVGYSTCHWCHVMEEESFEDPEIAGFMNANYIAIKVDREERPDIDEIYMTSIQAMSGQGGWPMTVWLTPDREPFYGGTYFPPRQSRGRRPGFLDLLGRLSEAYATDKEKIAERAAAVAATIRRTLVPEPSIGVPGSGALMRAFSEYRRRFDRKNGGVRSRTKFPSSLPIPLLLRGHRRTGDADLLEMARTTLDAMRRGGIYDHIGGGFHRYSTEPSWSVPHFEKMLYDNALLVVAYLEAFQVTGEEAYAAVVRDVLDYVMREMTAPGGAFFSATDADSEGEEGLFFIWKPAEMREAVGSEQAALAIDAYGLAGPPNFEGSHWVLRRDTDVGELAKKHGLGEAQTLRALDEIRAKLRSFRSKRIPPLLDDKQLVSWNGLMIQGFARAGLVLGESRYVAAGERAARDLLANARPGGELTRYLRGGSPHGIAMLDDYSFLVAGLLDLFAATGRAEWLDSAIELQDDTDRLFFDEVNGGYWISPSGGEKLLVREKPTQDGAVPSGNAYAVLNLLRLYTLTVNEDYQVRSEMTLRTFSDLLNKGPTGRSRMLDALDFMLDRPKEILIVTPGERSAAEPFLRVHSSVFLPNGVLVVVSEAEARALEDRIPWLEGKKALSGKTTAYVCEQRVCDLPARDTTLFAKQLAKKPLPYPPDTLPAISP